MATSIPLCGAYELQHIRKPSIVWCTDCEEGLCSECQNYHSVSKPSRNHNTLSINEYQELPSDVQQITQNCGKHDEKKAFTYYGLNIVKVFNIGGSKDFEVKKPPYVFDVAYIIEDNTLVVTSGDSERLGITIINIQNKNIKQEIPVDSYCYGIAVKDIQLICSAAGIQLIDPYNNATNEIVCEQLPKYCYVAHFGDKMYHTNNKTESVICYEQQGTVQWTFKNKSVLKNPCGISVDNDGNVYVVGNTSNNVVVISPDGKQHKKLLTASDGLSKPYSLDFCRSTNRLLVANRGYKAMVLL
ncbi:unnamed protein product [Mytilus coruscus]|uniref:B box-type domain-containing protein n=1 Tax=Mytilus coruscus TaxID=42192 RepID=A0A6J8C1C3_MYTCO|nr:unnamed protein product [Mytilus coruscus]